jgi:hypothetical protein
MALKHFPKLPQVQRVPAPSEWFKILLRQPKQPHRWAQSPPVFWMRWMLELLLQMHKRTCRLDQSLEILRIICRNRLPQPNLLEHVVRFVVTLLVPTPEKRPVIGMIRQRGAPRIALVPLQSPNELGNSLAFTHEGPNLVAPATMGKQSTLQFSGGLRVVRPQPRR